MKVKYVGKRCSTLWHAKDTVGTWFITFNTSNKIQLTLIERMFILNLIKEGSGVYYDLITVVVMKDHVHLIIRLNGAATVARIISAIKGRTSKHFVKTTSRTPPFWQADWHEVELVSTVMLLSRIGYVQKNIAEALHDGDLVDAISFTAGMWMV